MLISLHLGAHKTASTYIQRTLRQSRDALREKGVGYLPLREVRPAITKRLATSSWLDPVELRPATRRLLREHRDCGVLIISDENLLGGLKPRLGEYYYNRRPRLGRVLRAIGRNNVKIFFAARSYDTFISSMYCECIRHNRFVDAQSYVRDVDIGSFSWLAVIGTFVSLAGAENVVVWRYEDFSFLERQVFAGLTAGVADALDKPAGRLRQSLSAEAVDSLAELRSTLTPGETRLRVRAAAAAFPVGPDRPPFSAFDAVVSERLRARYEHDMSLLEDEFPGITILRPMREAIAGEEMLADALPRTGSRTPE